MIDRNHAAGVGAAQQMRLRYCRDVARARLVGAARIDHRVGTGVPPMLPTTLMLCVPSAAGNERAQVGGRRRRLKSSIPARTRVGVAVGSGSGSLLPTRRRYSPGVVKHSRGKYQHGLAAGRVVGDRRRIDRARSSAGRRRSRGANQLVVGRGLGRGGRVSADRWR